MSNQGSIAFNRPPRIQRALPKAEVEIPPPPERQFKGTRLEWAILVAPIALAILTAISMAIVTLARSTNDSSGPLFLITSLTMSVGFLVTSTLGLFEKLSRDRVTLKEYIELLDERENQLKGYRAEQQTILHYLYPSLEQLKSWTQFSQPPRLWERRPEDEDFLKVRLGTGTFPSSVNVETVKSDKKLPFLERAQAVASSYREVPDVPYPVDLKEVAFLSVVGLPDKTAALVRSMICHITAQHDPEVVKVLATYSPERNKEWSWLGWLPHSRQDTLAEQLVMLKAFKSNKKVETTSATDSTISLVEGEMVTKIEATEETKEAKQETIEADKNAKAADVKTNDDIPPTGKEQAAPLVTLLASQEDQLESMSKFVLETLKLRKLRSETAPKQDEATKRKGLAAHLPVLIWVVDNFELVRDVPGIRRVFECGADLGVYLITTCEELADVPGGCHAIVEIRPNGEILYSVTGKEGKVATVQPELASLDFCEEFAVAMTPITLRAVSDKGNIPTSLRLLDLLGVDVSRGVDPLLFWNRSAGGQLKVPVGRVFGGQIIELDLSDKGHGPHGMIAGTTGSGKSVLLQAIICALAMYNHPDNLNFILGDFKGGATINPFKDLPHVVGMLTNQDLTMVERAMTAIYSELKRREKLLEKEGVTHIRDYQKKNPRPEEPMPYLVVILDEVAELKDQAPDFLDRIVNIARKGRTLGVHVILATQRTAGIVTPQINSNTKFRISLRVETSEDSTDMLGRDDAYKLSKDQPGRAYIKVGNDVYEQFQTANTEIAFVPKLDSAKSENRIATLSDPRNWRTVPLLTPKVGSDGSNVNVDSDSEIYKDYHEIAAQCAAAAKRTLLRNTHKPWLDPMGASYYLRAAQFLGKRGFNEQALDWSEQPPYGYAAAPIALVDNVVEQKQQPLIMNLTKDGSYAITGVTVAGKTVLLQTMLTSLALTHKPEDINFYILDLGNKLNSFANLPHTACYVPMAEQDNLRQVIKELYKILQERKALFGKKGFLDITSYRANAENIPYIFVAFDNYTNVRESPLYSEDQLTSLMREGRAFGIHLALVMGNTNEISFQLRGYFMHIALRQDSDLIPFSVPKTMVGSWNDKPGRGFIEGPPHQPPLELQILLPGKENSENLTAELEEIVTKMQTAAAKNPAWLNQKRKREEARAARQEAEAPAANNYNFGYNNAQLEAEAAALFADDTVAEPVATPSVVIPSANGRKNARRTR